MTIAGFRVLNIRSPFIVTLVRGKHRTMSPIDPPLEVRGVTEWRPELFNTSVLIPRLSVKSEQVGPVRKILEKYLLKVANLKPIQECDRSKDRKICRLSTLTVNISGRNSDLQYLVDGLCYSSLIILVELFWLLSAEV